MLAAVYPDYEWLLWKFGILPKQFRNDETNARKFLEWAGKQLGVQDLDDWNKISFQVENKTTLFFLL